MARKIYFILILFFAFVCQVYAYTDDNLSVLEKQNYGMSFEDESLSDRLNRLEENFFGMAQSGDLESRFDNLFKISNPQKESAIITPDYDYYSVSKPKKAIIKNFLDNVTAPFSQGVVTGFTPPIGYSSGFSSYGNDFMNFFDNNSNKYCPYHNSYHDGYRSNNKFFRKYNNNLSRYNRYKNYRPHRMPRYGHNHPYHNSSYNPHLSQNYRPTYGNTSFSTGSTVRIINDWIKKENRIGSLFALKFCID